ASRPSATTPPPRATSRSRRSPRVWRERRPRPTGSGPDGLTFRAPLPITPGTMRPALRLVETPRRREAQRRRTDRAHSSVPADRLAAARGRKPKPPTGPTLRTQVVGPFGLGMAALVGA